MWIILPLYPTMNPSSSLSLRGSSRCVCPYPGIFQMSQICRVLVTSPTFKWCEIPFLGHAGIMVGLLARLVIFPKLWPFYVGMGAK
jgi:hypothetical protein